MKPLRIAAITSCYHILSHADVIVSRWLAPLKTDLQFGFHPKSTIVSLFVDQLPKEDPLIAIAPFSERSANFKGEYSEIGHAISKLHNIPLFTTIKDALTLGGETLEVDAVLMICEHGEFPRNEDQVKLYPRKEYFDQIAAVFKETGKSVPVFCDKHLSYSFDFAKEMVSTAKKLEIPFFSASSLPFMVGYERLSENLPAQEALGIYWVDPEAYGYHSIEMVQRVIDRHITTQQGIRSIRTFKGDAVREAFASGELPQDLLEAAIAQASNKSENPLQCPTPVAFQLEYIDGRKATHLHCEDRILGFIVAERTADGIKAAEIMGHRNQDPYFCPHFATLCREIEKFFQTKTPPYPIERSLLTAGALATMVKLLRQPTAEILTPQLQIPYSTH